MSKLQQGSEVRLLFDVVNDGTVYGAVRGELLQKAGSVGYVKQFGDLINGVVYDVHFLENDRIVGCRDWELLPAEAAWSPAAFAKKEKVFAATSLSSNIGTVPANTAGEVIGIRYVASLGYVYEVRFSLQGEAVRFVVRKEQIAPLSVKRLS